MNDRQNAIIDLKQWKANAKQRVESAVRQLGDPDDRQNALKYARQIYKIAHQGFYNSAGQQFDLMMLCLDAAGFRIEAEYAEAFPDNTLDLFEETEDAK